MADSHLGVALLVGVLVGNLVEARGAVLPIIASGYSKRFAVGSSPPTWAALGSTMPARHSSAAPKLSRPAACSPSCRSP